MQYIPSDGCRYARLFLLPAFIFFSFSVMAQAADNAENLMLPLPVSVVGQKTELLSGAPCDTARGTISVWVNNDLPKLTTSSITAGRTVNVTGAMLDGLAGTLRFEIYDYATSQKEWTSEPVQLNGTATPNTYQVPLTFPKAGAEKLIFGCFVDAKVDASYTGVGQRIFPDFANSFSVAGAPGGGGGCVAAVGQKFDPTWIALLALALGGLWLRRRDHND